LSKFGLKIANHLYEVGIVSNRVVEWHGEFL